MDVTNFKSSKLAGFAALVLVVGFLIPNEALAGYYYGASVYASSGYGARPGYGPGPGGPGFGPGRPISQTYPSRQGVPFGAGPGNNSLAFSPPLRAGIGLPPGGPRPGFGPGFGPQGPNYSGGFGRGGYYAGGYAVSGGIAVGGGGAHGQAFIPPYQQGGGGFAAGGGGFVAGGGIAVGGGGCGVAVCGACSRCGGGGSFYKEKIVMKRGLFGRQVYKHKIVQGGFGLYAGGGFGGGGGVVY